MANPKANPATTEEVYVHLGELEDGYNLLIDFYGINEFVKQAFESVKRTHPEIKNLLTADSRPI